MKNRIISERQCILWGSKRHIYEFIYMFDSLDYLGFIPSDDNKKYNINLKKLSISELYALEKEEILIIICDLDLTFYLQTLKKENLIDVVHYISFEKCFELLDQFNDDILDNRKIAVWGTGDTEATMRKAMKENDYNIKFDIYIDSDMKKKNSLHCGIPVKDLSDISDIKQYFVIIASIFYFDIKEELDKYGMVEGKDYLPFSVFMSKPSAMFKELVCSQEFTDFYCDRPYKWFYYAWFGAYPCCSTWVKYPIGNPATDLPERCWNSTVAKLYRLSSDIRTYCFCKKDACGQWGNIEDNVEKKDFSVPEIITLGLDYSCNLHCTSCRDNVQRVSGEQLRIREGFAERIIRTGWLEKAKVLELSGSGEALFSPIDRKILFSDFKCKREAISLMSNGILLNEENLEKLKHNYKSIQLKISIDAASEKTYQTIRRGGNWEVLLKNLSQIGSRRIMKEIDYLEIRMVVQKSNYKEMLAFIEMGKNYHVDRVVFTKLLNWDMYSFEEYIDEAMLNKDGSLKKELKAILRMKEFQDPLVSIEEFNRYLKE